MKIILKKDYELLGDAGQIIEVKNGYARNYLIPNGIATVANDSNLKSFEEIKRQQKRKIEKLTEEAQKLSSDLSKNTIEISVKTGEENKIFGSVTSQMIYDKLKEKGFEDIDKKRIIIKEPIKALGEYEVEIKLQPSVISKIKVNVVKENQQPETENSEKAETTEIIQAAEVKS